MSHNSQQILGIFGGTFDPIHFGHLRSLVEVQQQCNFDELHLIPAALPPHRQTPQTSAAHRLAMCQLALAHTKIPQVVINDCELQRCQPSYTIETVAEFRKQSPSCRICLIIGMDAFRSLPSWYQWEKLTAVVHLLVLHRPNYQDGPFAAALQPLLAHQVDCFEELRQTDAGKIMFQEVTALDISATAIRAQIAAGQRPSFLMPEVVIDYIEQHQLYVDGK